MKWKEFKQTTVWCLPSMIEKYNNEIRIWKVSKNDIRVWPTGNEKMLNSTNY